MRRRVRLVVTGMAVALLGVAVVFVPGCQYSYPYELRLVVRSAVDASPLAGVTVRTDAGQMTPREDGPAVTAPDGSFGATISVRDSEFFGNKHPRWTLTLARDGYADELIDISPQRQPESGSPPTQLVVVAYLRPKTP